MKLHNNPPPISISKFSIFVNFFFFPYYFVFIQTKAKRQKKKRKLSNTIVKGETTH